MTDSRPQARSLNRYSREAEIRRVLQRVNEQLGMDLQVVRAIVKNAQGYQLQRVIDSRIEVLAGPLPGVVVEHYLEGMLVALKLLGWSKP